MSFQASLALLPAWAEYDANALVAMATATIEDVETGRIEPVGVESEPNPYYPIGGFVDLGLLEPMAVLEGAPPEDLGIRYDEVVLLADAAHALDAATVLLGFEPPGVPAVLPESVASIVLVLQDGRVVFIQVCSDYLQDDLDAFATMQTRFLSATPADLLRRMVSRDPEVAAAYLEWAQGPPPVAWEDLPPGERSLDPEETPADVLSGLRQIEVVFDTPRAWWGRAEVLCTRASLGWNECVSLILGDQLEVLAYTVPGEPLEVVVLPEDADMQGVIVVLGEIPAEVLDSLTEEAVRVEILPSTLEEAVAAVARHELVLRVAP
jgi:hypothetical protein